MNALGILALLVYTAGAYAYGTLLFLSLGAIGTRGWAGQPRADRGPTEAELAGGAMLALGFLWFVANVAAAVQELRGVLGDTPVQWVLAYAVFLYPPLIMHVTYAEYMADPDPAARRPAAVWRRLSRAAYAIVPAIPVGATLAFTGVVPANPRHVNVALNVLLPLSFIAATAYSVAMSRIYKRPAETPRARVGGRAMNAMFGLMAVVFILLLVFAFTAEGRPEAIVGRLVEMTARSLPLAFLFVGAYFESRFEFFDVLVKRGLSLAVTIAALWGFFSLGLVDRFQAGTAAPWISAVILLPVVLALQGVHRGMSAALDRRWLGRRYSVVEAVKHAVARLRSATTEPQLVEAAEGALGDIFGAPALVRLGAPGGAPPFQVLHQVPIRGPHGVSGAIVMGPRASEAPYFSEDVALLDSLADVLASVLENLHLQQRRREQEQRAQELSLHASRSELKALRAQINPHFLFNALNAVAGLIHRDPRRADRTIEQLADVFRYALRGAESEWASLDEEIAFVRAYLEVERARFGERLQVEVRVADAARGARIPTMVVQTLVENAVKHGLSDLRGAALVRVEAACENGRLTVMVTDNGPGFTDRAKTAVEDRPRSGGYGLANIRQRLHGYFGPSGTLAIARDDAGGLTRVSVEMPIGGAP